MNSRKVYFIMLAVLVLLIGALLGTVVMGNNYLKNQSDSLLAAKLDQQSLNEQQTALVKAKKDLEKYRELRDIARAIVPQDKDQAKAVREIVRFADETGVGLESITFDDSSLGQKAAAPAPAAGGETQTAASEPAAKPKTPPITQAQPVAGIPGVYSLPIEIVSTKNTNQFNNFINFLSKLENNRRTAQVEKVSITPGTTASGQEYINFSLTVNIFVQP
jgi:septum formation inhibitor MinC